MISNKRKNLEAESKLTDLSRKVSQISVKRFDFFEKYVSIGNDGYQFF